MSRHIVDICSDIDAFRPIDGEWLALEDLILESLDNADAMSAIPTLLAVFARFPDDDRAGVFWSIIHGLESLDGYESFLLDAVRNHPTDLSLTMVNRLLNGGITEYGGVFLLSVLQAAAQNESHPDSVRATASQFVERHST
jgi:hypothetical protein